MGGSSLKNINVGIVGYGLSGKTFHASLLKEITEFTIMSVVSSRIEEIQQDLGNIEVVKDISELLHNELIDLVVITTPSHLHYEMVKESLLAGKHVVVEKPMVISASEGVELAKLAEDKNLILSVYHNRRWDNDFLTVQKLISTGEIGEVSVFESQFNRFRPEVKNRWKEKAQPGGGTLYDLGSHLIDQALVLFGMPKSIMADVQAQREGSEAVDYFHLVLIYDQLRVILHSGSIVPGSGPRYQVHGSKKSYIKYGLDGQEDKLRSGLSPLERDFGSDQPHFYGKILTETSSEEVVTEHGSYLTYYYLLRDSILSGGVVPVSAYEGARVIQVIEAAIKSSDENRVVYINE
ncbi:oxidoreductase [Bacillus coahuilensis m2-6]|nr:oxidoreductase [Bacillus coahuilensis m2-6]